MPGELSCATNTPPTGFRMGSTHPREKIVEVIDLEDPEQMEGMWNLKLPHFLSLMSVRNDLNSKNFRKTAPDSKQILLELPARFHDARC